MGSGEEGAAVKLLLLLISSEADLAACRKSWKLLSSKVQLLQLGWRLALWVTSYEVRGHRLADATAMEAAAEVLAVFSQKTLKQKKNTDAQKGELWILLWLPKLGEIDSVLKTSSLWH
jgi:hypothetical protein